MALVANKRQRRWPLRAALSASNLINREVTTGQVGGGQLIARSKVNELANNPEDGRSGTTGKIVQAGRAAALMNRLS